MKKIFLPMFLLTALIFTLSLLAPLISPLEKLPAVTIQFPNRIQEVLPSVVHIMCDQRQGSGVVLTEDIVVTARHIISGNDYTITLNDGTVIKGIQAITHKDYDIGFIKVDKPLLKPAKFGSINDCVLGQSVFIIGSPYGKINFNSVTLGIISGLDRNWESTSRYGESYGWEIAFTSDSVAHPGNSGGPVFTMDGVVRGLLVGSFSPVLNCSMPSDLFLNDIGIIELMFGFNQYSVEKEKEYNYYIYDSFDE